MRSPIPRCLRSVLVMAACWKALLASGAALTGGQAAEPAVTLRTRTATFTIDTRGWLTGIHREPEGPNVLAAHQPAPLLRLRGPAGEEWPGRATWAANSGRLTLEYPDSGARVVLTAQAKPTHVVFEVRSVEPGSRSLEVIVWGPYPIGIRGTVGETVGVVRDQEFAVGIQSLNAKTLGGYPSRDNDTQADFTEDDQGLYPDLPEELKKAQLFRGDTARRTPFGAVLQAYCRNRDRDRTVANWGHDRYLAPAFADGGLLGSRIALFAGPASDALATLGAIELSEGLPHPLLDGVWGKDSPEATRSYLIVDFSEDSVERAVAMTRRAGLRYLYHSSPFEAWGHFRLKPDLFPHGWDGLRACVATARAAGVRLGVHTLSNFITPNDPYVTPRPDSRLARIGVGTLTAGASAAERELPVADPSLFRKGTALNTVVLDDELIRYAKVSDGPPWRLTECERGAWGTAAAAHPAGTPMGRLMDHAYNVFLTDADLSQEVARTIARLCGETGIRQLSFDGLEGNWSTGMGQYGRTLFTQAWYQALPDDLRGQVINDASNPGHFNWHVYTRMNWGEPWYAGFRESQTLYRFKNQLYFDRNLMPRMLGWFALRPDTTLEDAEWLLARAAGFDAGFALAASLASTAQLEADPASAEAVQRFGAIPAILEAVAQWETARMARAFPAEIRARLRDNSREFHLEARGPGHWALHTVHAERFATETTTSVPEVTHDFLQPHDRQRAHWTLRNAGKEPVTRLILSLDARRVMDLDGQSIPPGCQLRYSGLGHAAILDKSGRESGRVTVNPEAATVATGNRRMSLTTGGPTAVNLMIEWRTVGPAIPIQAPSNPAPPKP